MDISYEKYYSSIFYIDMPDNLNTWLIGSAIAISLIAFVAGFAKHPSEPTGKKMLTGVKTLGATLSVLALIGSCLLLIFGSRGVVFVGSLDGFFSAIGGLIGVIFK